MRLIFTLTPLALVAACAQASSGEASEPTAATPDRDAVELPGKPATDEAEAPAGDETLRDMRPTDAGPDSDCEETTGADNPCIQGNYRPLPDEPEGE